MFCNTGIRESFARITEKYVWWFHFLMKFQSQVSNYIEKKLSQVFTCEFRKNFKSAFFIENLRTTASADFGGAWFSCFRYYGYFKVCLHLDFFLIFFIFSLFF